MGRNILYSVFAITVGIAIYAFLLNRPERESPFDKGVSTPISRYPEQSAVHLYFVARETFFLKAEKRAVYPSEDPAAFGRVIIEALLEGSREGRVQAIPEGTTLRAIYISRDGIAYVDLSEAISENHPGGVESEMMTIYSIVNSLVLNVSKINAVKLLIGGREVETLAGHIDLRLPFRANMLLVR